MRNIARSAGVHIWLETDDALYADNQFVGVHAATGGTKLLHLPDARSAVDAISGKSLPLEEHTARLPMQQSETVLLRWEHADGK
jgi:hypothetical protein